MTFAQIGSYTVAGYDVPIRVFPAGYADGYKKLDMDFHEGYSREGKKRIAHKSHVLMAGIREQGKKLLSF